MPDPATWVLILEVITADGRAVSARAFDNLAACREAAVAAAIAEMPKATELKLACLEPDQARTIALPRPNAPQVVVEPEDPEPALEVFVPKRAPAVEP